MVEPDACAGEPGAEHEDALVTRRAANAVAILFLLVQAGALVWPVAAMLNRPDVRVLGLPLPFAWSVGWVAATFVVMGWLLMVERMEPSE